MPHYRRAGCLALFAWVAGFHLAAADLTRTPLKPASPGATPVLFTQLDAQATGLKVENLYDDPQMWGTRYRPFMGGAMGSGVAVGDYDGDGWVDLYVSTKTKPGRLFRNRGGWKFEDVTDAAGLSEDTGMLGWIRSKISSDAPVVWRQGAVFADVNNDGLLDLHVSRIHAPNLLYINQGDGTFTEEAEKRGLALNDGSVIAAFADYDRDGWLDVLILTNQVEGTEPAGRPDRLFRNTGNGRFTEVTEAAGLRHTSFGHAATWFDYDDDGWPDLYIANDFAGPDTLYRNNGDGTFTDVIDRVAPHTPYSSMGADTGDVNNDGHFDLLVADMATTTREKDRRGLAASRDDMLSAGMKPGTAPQVMRNTLLLNTGLGVFREAACWAGVHATDWTWSVRFEDFDQDGWEDLHVTNGMVREANNGDLLASMMRALSDMERIRVVKNAPPLNEANLAYRNLEGNGFEPVTDAWGLGEVGVTFGAATGDFDNDGDLDLVTLNYNGGLSVFRNESTGRHRVLVRLQGTRSNRFGVGAIVRAQTSNAGTQSRLLTVARGYAAGSELVAHFGLGATNKIDRLTVEWPSGITQEFFDLPGDHAYLVKEPTTASTQAPAPAAAPLFVDASARFALGVADDTPLAVPDREQALLPFRTDRRGPGVASADVNGDGLADLYLGATRGSPPRLLVSQDRVYREVPTSGLPAAADVEEGPALWVDVDGDGVAELLTTRASAKATAWPAAFRPTLYAHDGAGRFTDTNQLPHLTINTGAVCAADVDGDGDIDIFLGARSIPGRYPLTPQSILLRNEGGKMIEATDALPEAGKLGLVKSALFRDVDQDGKPDLVLAMEWDHVRYLRNRGDGRFEDRTIDAGFATGGRGLWNSLAAADFNGDGVLDFVAGNLGHNTPYRATATEPVTLLYGDFARNGNPILLEAVYDGGTLYPSRSRNDLGARLPSILRKYPKNDDYARATLVDIVGSEAIDAAKRYEADNLLSGVFLSQPGGTFRFTALPGLAQNGPITGLVAQDLDGDGREDIAAVQNSDVAVPRFDGGVGLLILGNGRGYFEVLEPKRSGVLVTGNGGALVPVDAEGRGRPGLFFTRPAGTSGYLHPQPTDGSSWLHLQLRAAAPNRNAIGARVRLAFSDDSHLVREIGSGGGWWSQASSALFVSHSATRRLVAVEVIWPDGRQTTHRNVPADGTWLIDQTALK